MKEVMVRFQLNGQWIDTLKEYESVKNEIFINHPRNIPSFKSDKDDVSSMNCINYFIEQKKGQDLIFFLKKVKTELSYQDIYDILLNFKNENKEIAYLKLLENFIFESKEIKGSQRRIFKEEKYRHQLIFRMADFMNYDYLLEKWDDLKAADYFVKSYQNFSLKSLYLWSLDVPEKNKDFYQYLLNSKYSYILAQSHKNNKNISSNIEDIIFNHISFNELVKVEQYFKDIEQIKSKYMVDETARDNVINIIRKNRNLNSENIFLFKDKYNEIYKRKEKINIVNCLFYLQENNGEIKDKLTNKYMERCINDLEKDFNYVNEGHNFKTWMTALLEICLENIENKNTLNFVNEKIEKYKLDKKETYQGSWANVNMYFKHSREDLDYIFNEIRKHKKDLSYVLLPSRFLSYSKNRENSIMIENIIHYLPFYLEELKRNNNKVHPEDSVQIIKQFQNDDLSILDDIISTILIESEVDLKYLQELYVEDGFKQLSFMKNVLINKEKEIILKGSDENKITEKIKKRI